MIYMSRPTITLEDKITKMYPLNDLGGKGGMACLSKLEDDDTVATDSQIVANGKLALANSLNTPDFAPS